MKKLLALVLALVMTLSLCVTSNAAFTDAKDVNADYEEAVAVLNGMGVFKGYEDGSFKPEGNITRAEVAAIVYRLYTGDVKDKQAGLYAGYGKFDDMAGAQWAAGYVGFCANAGFVKGYGNGKFGPSDQVTGYQALAMILRAVGYGQNGEFEGADWELHVAQVAQQVGALKNVKNTSLKAAATRQLVAELLFQVASDVATVTYTPAFGYVSDKFTTNGKEIETETLGWTNFRLTKDTEGNDDDWGRPAYIWYGEYSDKDAKYAEEYDKYAKDTKDVKYATICEKAVATFTEAATYAEVCEALGESKEAKFTCAYVDGDKVTNVPAIKAANKTAELGAQGLLMEFYEDGDNYRIVYVNTYLAKVTKVVEEKLDKNGNVNTDAYMVLDGRDYVKGNAYEKDDYVLVNVNDVKDVEIKMNGATKKCDLVEVVGLADSVEGKFTGYTGNLKTGLKSVKVDGETYDVAANAYLEGTNVKKTYTWFFDQYGNVIGNAEVENTYSYGVIKNIQWINPTTANGYAQATVVYMDGSEELKTVAKINSAKVAYSATAPSLSTGSALNYVSTSMKDNKAVFAGSDLFKVYVNSDDELELAKVGGMNDAWTTYTEGDHDELTHATVKTGVSAIRGSETIYTNDDTVYLVETYNGKGEVTGYESVEGFSNVANYTDVTVDYVLNSAKTYAKYVFIKGQADDATATKLFFVTNVDVDIDYDSTDEVYYVSVTGILDGEENSTLKVKVDPDRVNATEADLKLQRMYFVTFSGDYVVGAEEVETNYYKMYQLDGSVYDDMYITFYQQETGATVKVDGNVLNLNGFHLNVTKATAVFGDLDSIDENCNVYVIYDNNTKKNAVAIYVGDYVSYAAEFTVTITYDDTKTYVAGDTIVLTAKVKPYVEGATLGKLDYEWWIDETKQDETGDTLTVTGLAAGEYEFYCRVNEYDSSKDLPYDYDYDYVYVTFAAKHSCNLLAFKEDFIDYDNDVDLDMTVNVTGFDTYKVSDLLADVYVVEEGTTPCTKAKIEVKDNHGVLAETAELTGYVGKTDLKIVVTAEDGDTLEYPLTIAVDEVKYTVVCNGCTSNKGKFVAGEPVTLTVDKVAAGKTVLFSVDGEFYTVKNNAAKEEKVTFTFTMPAKDVTVSASVVDYYAPTANVSTIEYKGLKGDKIQTPNDKDSKAKVEKAAELPKEAVFGTELTFTVSVGNGGQDVAQDVTVTVNGVAYSPVTVEKNSSETIKVFVPNATKTTVTFSAVDTPKQ